MAVQAAAERRRSLLDTPILSYIILNWETILYLTIFVVAIASRFSDLGIRALHHDESIHARWSWDLYSTGRTYVHDPVYHGPFLYHIVALSFFLFGASDAATRIPPAVFGVMLVIAPLLLRRYLGRWGAVATSLFILISPSILYYSRALRHDIFALWGTMLIVTGIFMYLSQQKNKWFYLAAIGFAVSYASHELTFLTGYIILGALDLAIIYEYTGNRWLTGIAALVFAFAPTIWLPGGVVLVVLPAAIFLGGLLLSRLGRINPDSLRFGLVTTTVVDIPFRVYGISLGMCLLLWIPLYTTLFTNMLGLTTGSIGAITYWLSQQPVQRGTQPWYYYLIMVPLEEFLPLFFGVLGAIYWVVKKFRRTPTVHELGQEDEDQRALVGSYFPFFVIYWFIATLALYSWAGEKMPWLTMHIALTLCVLAGWFIGRFAEVIDLQHLRANGALGFGLLLPTLVLLIVGWVGFQPGVAVNQLTQQSRTFQQALLLIIIAAAVGAFVWLGMRLGLKGSLQTLGVTLFIILGLFSIRTAWMDSYTFGDIARDPLIYVQTSPDVTNVVNRIQALSMRLTSSQNDLVVDYDDESSWPLSWYFRDFKNQKFEPKGPTTPPDAPVVIVGLANDPKVKPLMGKYDRTQLKLRWWFPEDYKAPGWFSIQTAINTLTNPVKRSELVRFLLFRELHDPNTDALVTNGMLGSTDFVVYVRKDLTSSFWSGGPLVTSATNIAAAAGGVSEDTYLQKTRTVTATLSFGSKGTANGQFADPKNLAVDKNGNIYVADSGNNRIEKFDSTGKFLLAFGSKGSGDGQFDEPWGVAVDSDGNIYVADTWNYRIQKFDSTGKFITKWGDGLVDTHGEANGTPGVFYGPRALTFDSEGYLYVMDTGNKRVQKFDKDGKFVGQFGTVGTDNGMFDEPVGLAIDKDGNIYVADTWNHRIQKFDKAFNYITQWPVLGWDSDNRVTNKPYLAVDSDGNVYASDSVENRIVKFSGTGTVLAVWGQYGTDNTSLNMPYGIAIDGSGNIFVADSLNERIVQFPPVK